MKKYSVSLHGHATSVSVEPEFWEQLCNEAEQRGQSVASLITMIDDQRAHDTMTGLSGALRLFVLKTLLDKIDNSAKS